MGESRVRRGHLVSAVRLDRLVLDLEVRDSQIIETDEIYKWRLKTPEFKHQLFAFAPP